MNDSNNNNWQRRVDNLVRRERRAKFYAAVLAVLCLMSLLLVTLLLAGCLPARPPAPPPKAAQITAKCHGCLSENVGIAPLDVVLWASAPDGALSYEWDLGDNTATRTGRFLTHIYQSPGRYLVSLRASVVEGAGIRRKTVFYEAQTAFIALAPPSLPSNTQRFENEFISLSVITPQSLALGQAGVVLYILQSKRNLAYIDLRSVPDNHLYSHENGYLQKVLVPAGAVLEFQHKITGYLSGNGSLQVILITSDGKTSAEINERLAVEVLP